MRKVWVLFLIASFLLILGTALSFADEPTTRELELEKALKESQIQVLQLQFKEVGERLNVVTLELAKRQAQAKADADAKAKSQTEPAAK